MEDLTKYFEVCSFFFSGRQKFYSLSQKIYVLLKDNGQVCIRGELENYDLFGFKCIYEYDTVNSPYILKVENSGKLTIEDYNQRLVYSNIIKKKNDYGCFKMIVTDDPMLFIVNFDCLPAYAFHGLTQDYNSFYSQFDMILPQDYKLFSPIGKYFVSSLNTGKLIFTEVSDYDYNIIHEEVLDKENNTKNLPYSFILSQYGQFLILNKNFETIWTKGDKLKEIDCPFIAKVTNNKKFVVNNNKKEVVWDKDF